MIARAQSAKDHLKKVPRLIDAVTAARQARSAAFGAMYDARFFASRVRRRRQIDAYLREHPVRKLQLGSGSNRLEGWLNTDVADLRRNGEVVYLDARKPFPLPDSSFDFVFSEHMLEHMSLADGSDCLRECRRVLRPEGRIRVATPSLRHLVRLYDDHLTDIQRRYIQWSIETWLHGATDYLPGFVVNNFFRAWGHEFIYDEQTLSYSLEAAGFVDVDQFCVRESNAPELRDLERHMQSAAEFNELETMVLEARRP